MNNEFHFDLGSNDISVYTFDWQKKRRNMRLSSAINFMANNSWFEMCWGEEKIPLSYSDDFSLMIDDVIQMIFMLHEHKKGEWSVEWMPYTFAVNWHLTWEDDLLQIKADYRDESQASDYLKTNNLLTIQKTAFLAEWNKLFEALAYAFYLSEYSTRLIIDGKNFRKAKRYLQKYDVLE